MLNHSRDVSSLRHQPSRLRPRVEHLPHLSCVCAKAPVRQRHARLRQRHLRERLLRLELERVHLPPPLRRVAVRVQLEGVAREAPFSWTRTGTAGATATATEEAGAGSERVVCLALAWPLTLCRLRQAQAQAQELVLLPLLLPIKVLLLLLLLCLSVTVPVAAVLEQIAHLLRVLRPGEDRARVPCAGWRLGMVAEVCVCMYVLMLYVVSK